MNIPNIYVLITDVDRKDNIDILEAVEEVSGDEVDADYTEYMTGTGS